MLGSMRKVCSEDYLMIEGSSSMELVAGELQNSSRISRAELNMTSVNAGMEDIIQIEENANVVISSSSHWTRRTQ